MLLSNVDVPGFDETDHDATDDDSSASGSPVPQKSDSTSGCKAVDQLSGEQSAGQHQASVTFGSKDEKAGKVVSFAEILMSEPTAILVPDLQKSVAARALFDQAYQHARVLLPD